MTDEEMAKQFADGYATPDIEPILRMHLYECSKESFFAGLKESRPKWHDLRKDPNDLPLKMGIGSEVVLISYDGEVTDFAYYNFESKRWEHDEDDFYICDPSPIAWCEIPQFEKEVE